MSRFWNNKYYTVCKEVMWEDRIYAIMGRMHLTGEMFEPLIPKIINELERLKPNS
jgi:7,8-dihydropterin-6-yl-methyl-4-(beta-D-ribofuranosyl)aminobenzene 5'-phosphate synthase